MLPAEQVNREPGAGRQRGGKITVLVEQSDHNGRSAVGYQERRHGPSGTTLARCRGPDTDRRNHSTPELADRIPFAADKWMVPMDRHPQSLTAVPSGADAPGRELQNGLAFPGRLSARANGEENRWAGWRRWCSASCKGSLSSCRYPRVLINRSSASSSTAKTSVQRSPRSLSWARNRGDLVLSQRHLADHQKLGARSC